MGRYRSIDAEFGVDDIFYDSGHNGELEYNGRKHLLRGSVTLTGFLLSSYIISLGLGDGVYKFVDDLDKKLCFYWKLINNKATLCGFYDSGSLMFGGTFMWHKNDSESWRYEFDSKSIIRHCNSNSFSIRPTDNSYYQTYKIMDNIFYEIFGKSLDEV